MSKATGTDRSFISVVRFSGSGSVSRGSRRSAPRLPAPSMLLDLRFTLRALAKTPGFTALLVIVLALAVGLCGASFSLLKAFFLAELPFPESARLIAFGFRDTK